MTYSPMTLTDNAVGFLLNGTPHLVPRSSPHFLDVLEALRQGDNARLLTLLHPQRQTKAWLHRFPSTRLDGNTLYVGDVVFTGAIVSKLYRLQAHNLDPTPLLRFCESLGQSPSHGVVTGLFDFIERHGLYLDEEGYVVCWKYVRKDYYDMHSGRYLNVVGSTHTMPRYLVCDDRDNACAPGFHVGSFAYANSRGDRTMVVRVHPAAFVSVPRDHNCAKARVTTYTVTGEVDRATVDPTQFPEIYPAFVQVDEDEDEDTGALSTR